MPLGRVYGGQVLAQSIVAAERTIPDGRSVHSMHGYFLRPGDASKGITFAVDRIHDGRSFSTRRTQAFQEGVPIFSMIASFQDEDPGIEHQAPMPAGVPDPEDLPDLEDHLAGLHPMSKRLLHRSPGRSAPRPLADLPAPSRASACRARRCGCGRGARSPTIPRIHRAALAYLSDLTIQESILRAHGVAWATPGLKVASLDHAMWWHRPGRVDDWMLYVQESPSARGGRGLATGRIYSRDGDAAGQRRAGDHGAGAGTAAGASALTLLSAGARRRSARRGTAPRRRARSSVSRTGRPVAASTITTTAVARA